MINKRLLFLSGIAILAVAMNHASHQGFVAMFWWTDKYLPVTVPNFDQMGSLAYYGLVAQQKLAVFSVPAFLFITGMFLSYAARGSTTHLTWAMVWHRILNLLPPYLIWTIVYYVAEFLIGNRYTTMEYVLGIITISHSVFFFIPLVIVYYALSPLLAPLAKKRPVLLLCIGGLTLLMGILSGYFQFFAKLSEVNGSIFYSPLFYFVEHKFLEYLFYYLLGLVAGFHQPQLKAFIGRYRWALLGLTVLSGIAAVIEAEFVYQLTEAMWRSRTLTLPSAIYAISFILTFLAFENIKMPKIVCQLGVNTLGIYLIQKTVLLIAPKVVYHVLPFVLGIQWLYQLLLIGTAIAVPMLAMMITRKLPIRKYYRYLFG